MKKEMEEEEEKKVELKGDEDEITKFKVERMKYVKQKKEMKKKGQDRQDLTLQLLAKFQNKVKESQVWSQRLNVWEMKSVLINEKEKPMLTYYCTERGMGFMNGFVEFYSCYLETTVP